jgi:hypothetical protein
MGTLMVEGTVCADPVGRFRFTFDTELFEPTESLPFLELLAVGLTGGGSSSLPPATSSSLSSLPCFSCCSCSVCIHECNVLYSLHEGMQMGARMHSYQDVMVQLALVLQPPFLSQLEVAELSLVGSCHDSFLCVLATCIHGHNAFHSLQMGKHDISPLYECAYVTVN